MALPAGVVMPAGLVVAAGMVMAAGVVLGGCAGRGGAGPREDGREIADRVDFGDGLTVDPATLASYAPVKLRLHPLTRVQVDAGGEVTLWLHAELFDRWGHSVKSPGVFAVSVEAVGGGQESGRWSEDVREGARNALFWDRVTRTYRLPLTGLPGWLEASARGGGGGGGGVGGGVRGLVEVRVVAVFRGTAADGGTVTLKDEVRLGG